MLNSLCVVLAFRVPRWTNDSSQSLLAQAMNDPAHANSQALHLQISSNIGIEELIALKSCLPPLRFRVAAKVTYVRRTLDQRQTSCNSLVDECAICLLRLLPWNQIIFRAVNEECRRPVIATYDLGQWTDWNDFVQPWLRKRIPVSHLGACSFLLAGKATDYHGQCLRLPVDV